MLLKLHHGRLLNRAQLMSGKRKDRSKTGSDSSISPEDKRSRQALTAESVLRRTRRRSSRSSFNGRRTWEETG